ncbi:MAG: cytochrome P450 [Actinomycetes bacterium]
MTISKPPVEDFATDFDHTDPVYVADPFPIWDELRETCPVAHTTRYGGAWLPTRYADVSAIAHDTEHFTSRTVVIGNGRPGEDAPPAPMGVAPPISSDPPFHAIARRLMQPAFSPKSIEPYREFTRSLCRRLLAPFTDATQMDISVDYAEHIPTLVIAHMIGFPPEDEALFREFVHIVLEAVDAPVEERIEMFEPVRIYFERQLMDHLENPRDDLTDFLLNAEIGGQKLAPEHVFGSMVLLIVAGIDTTWSAIGSSLWYLAQHPDEAERLRHDPELMTLAIEEFLRAFSPVNMARLVKDDFDFNGCPMKKDDWILLSFPAANRDPEVFEDADKVIIDRKVNRHAAFGLGIHRCLGSNLARMEMRIAIEEFLAHFSTFTLADPDDVVWSQGQVRGVRKALVNIS